MDHLIFVLQIIAIVFIINTGYYLHKRFPGWYVSVGILAALIITGSVAYRYFFPKPEENEALRLVLEKYIYENFKERDFHITEPITSFIISNIVLLQDSSDDERGSIRARITGIYQYSVDEGEVETASFNIDHHFSYLIVNRKYRVYSHFPIPKFLRFKIKPGNEATQAQ